MDLPFRRGVAWSGLFLTLGLPCTDDRPAHSLQHRLIPYLQSHCVLHPSSSGLGPSSQSCSRTLTHTRSSGSSPSASHHTISSSLPTAPQHTISSHHRRPTTVHDNISRTTISHTLPIKPITHSTAYIRNNLQPTQSTHADLSPDVNSDARSSRSHCCRRPDGALCRCSYHGLLPCLSNLPWLNAP